MNPGFQPGGSAPSSPTPGFQSPPLPPYDTEVIYQLAALRGIPMTDQVFTALQLEIRAAPGIRDIFTTALEHIAQLHRRLEALEQAMANWLQP